MASLAERGELSLPDRLASGWEVGTLFGTRVNRSSGLAPFYRNPLRRGSRRKCRTLSRQSLNPDQAGLRSCGQMEVEGDRLSCHSITTVTKEGVDTARAKRRYAARCRHTLHHVTTHATEPRKGHAYRPGWGGKKRFALVKSLKNLRYICL